VVIGDLDIKNITVLKAEADSSLVVDPDAPLTGTVSAQRLQAIGGWQPQVRQAGCRIELHQAHRRPIPYFRR
jgi:hypothetical protein